MFYQLKNKPHTCLSFNPPVYTATFQASVYLLHSIYFQHVLEFLDVYSMCLNMRQKPCTVYTRIKLLFWSEECFSVFCLLSLFLFIPMTELWKLLEGAQRFAVGCKPQAGVVNVAISFAYLIRWMEPLPLLKQGETECCQHYRTF